MEILIKRINDDAKLPAYKQEVGPGIELYAFGEVIIEPGEKVLVSTGIAIAMPVGYVGLVWNQNNMILDQDIRVTATIIDSGYRDEVKVELFNAGTENRTIADAEVVAQLLVQSVSHARLIEAEDLSGFDTAD
ncbi:MAG: dUTP pyrophosphatase [Candidatus Paceibacteria bacterium]|jgi:dUTP pyrophosphatase